MAKDDFDSVLKDAIIETEKEIFAEAFGREDLTLDETGDRSLEAMGDGLEGQNEPDEDEASEDEEAEKAVTGDTEDQAKDETKVEAKPEAEDRQDERGRVPSGRLREQTERTRAAETERDAFKAQLDAEKAASQKAVADLNAKFDALLALQRQQAQPPKPAETVKPETPPDLFENPTAFAEHLQKGVQAELAAMRQQMQNERINLSMENARSRHGETFDGAFTAIRKLDPSNPDNRALVQRLAASPNPGEAMVAWHKRNEALREVGDDPTAYKAKIAEDTRKALMADPEFRKQLLEGLRAEAATGDNGQPRTTVRLPQSLNRAAGNNTRSPNDLELFDGSDQAIFESAFR